MEKKPCHDLFVENRVEEPCKIPLNITISNISFHNRLFDYFMIKRCYKMYNPG